MTEYTSTAHARCKCGTLEVNGKIIIRVVANTKGVPMMPEPTIPLVRCFLCGGDANIPVKLK